MSGSDITAVVIVVFLAALVQVTAGFGFSLTAVPLLAIAVDTRTASMLAAVLSLATSSVQAVQGRADVVWPVARRLWASALVGMPIGLLLFARADERALQLFLGVTTLVLVVLLLRRFDLSHAGRHVDLVAGAAAGVLTTSLNTNGPPLVFLLQGRGLDPWQFRATITTVFTLVGVIGLAGRAAVGGFTSEVLIACAVAPVPLLTGMFSGFRLRRHLDPERFRRLVMALLAVAAISAVVGALRG